jgi:hypothetical protein
MGVQCFHICIQNRAHVCFRFFIEAFGKKACRRCPTKSALDQGRPNFSEDFLDRPSCVRM